MVKRVGSPDVKYNSRFPQSPVSLSVISFYTPDIRAGFELPRAWFLSLQIYITKVYKIKSFILGDKIGGKIRDKIITNRWDPPLFLPPHTHTRASVSFVIHLLISTIENQSFILPSRHIDFINRASIGFGREKLSRRRYAWLSKLFSRGRCRLPWDLWLLNLTCREISLMCLFVTFQC